jgi:hypothetical protein
MSLHLHKFTCQSLPSPLPNWVKDWERIEGGIYIVYFDFNHPEWKHVEKLGDTKGYVNSLHELGFAYPEWVR